MKAILKTLVLTLICTLVSCDLFEKPEQQDYKMTTALSVFVKEGKVGTSILVNENYRINTIFAIDSSKSSYNELVELLPEGVSFRTSIDNQYRAHTIYKNAGGDTVVYKFPRNYSLYNDQLYYFKNNEKLKMDTAAYGAIHSVDATGDEVFAGFFGQRGFTSTGDFLDPKVAFYWDGTNNPVSLQMPNNYFYFKGVSCICKSGDDVYVGGVMDFPMYWKNGEVVRLESNYGEVIQIRVVGDDVYAVGFYNKRNSNSSNHTACYWKNEKLVELEDNAIANSIFIDGDDVYVAGAKGRFDIEYVACYWKNGKRIMLDL